MKPDMSPDIIGIGICTVDHLLTVSQMPKYGSVIKASQYLHQSGGLVASALVAATRLGATTKIVSRIGDDADGQYIQQDLDREGVDTSKLLDKIQNSRKVEMAL